MRTKEKCFAPNAHFILLFSSLSFRNTYSPFVHTIQQKLGLPQTDSKGKPKPEDSLMTQKTSETQGKYDAVKRVRLTDTLESKADQSLFAQNTLQEPTFSSLVMLYSPKNPDDPSKERFFIRTFVDVPMVTCL